MAIYDLRRDPKDLFDSLVTAAKVAQDAKETKARAAYYQAQADVLTQASDFAIDPMTGRIVPKGPLGGANRGQGGPFGFSGQLPEEELVNQNMMNLQGRMQGRGRAMPQPVASPVAPPPGAIPGMSTSRLPQGQPPLMPARPGQIPSPQYIPTKVTDKYGTTAENVNFDALQARDKEIDKRLMNVEFTSEDFKPFAGAFQLATAELKKEFGDDISDATLMGFGLRQAAKFKNVFGDHPETKAYSDEIQSFATPLAKSAGEDRLTDEDIKRFTKILPDVLGNPSEASVNKMRNLILSWKPKVVKRYGDEAAERVIANFITSFREAGGDLARVADKVESFGEDVKKAGTSNNNSLDALARRKGLMVR